MELEKLEGQLEGSKLALKINKFSFLVASLKS